jgi:hypothetical protein
VYSGDHGFKTSYPDGTDYNFEIPKEITDNFPKLIADLKEHVSYSIKFEE